jgi:ferritin
MSDALTAAYNRQIGLELESSHSYLQLAAFFADKSLTGFEQWMRVQAEEERAHAIKFFDFVLDRGRQVELGDISGPENHPSTALEAFEVALGQEEQVTASIEELLKLAEAEGDSASYPLLQWFLSEQVEEEASVGEIVDQLRFADGNPAAILMLDRERANRTDVAEE